MVIFMKDQDSSVDWRTGVRPNLPNSARMYNYFIGGKVRRRRCGGS